jgi:hypothetical protein
MAAENYKHIITEEGRDLIQKLCDAESSDDKFQKLAERHEMTVFTGGSGGRRIVEFPDKLVNDLYYTDYKHNTFYVLKVSSSTCPEIRREVEVWNKAKEEGDEKFFAQIDAWDDKNYKWLLMKRITPISPHKGDIAYLQNGQKYIHDEEAIEDILDQLKKQNWSVDDAFENTGFHEEEGRVCLFDFGGVAYEEESD